ncbi:hypothetical protein CVT26_006680 [Gymnopilus dilepis]|uniref:Beta-lactamase-related domain-containing protein n=1 Tax=Gymnopilus dilepis TaxID=231916 RepID=A0A409Y2P4_9AGAR|nr:hypothetical protein CVT26_006680 [Gymnopilus dilepis]
MKISFIAASLGSLLATTWAAPTETTSLAARSIPAWQFYYGVTAAQHQTSFNQWSAAGYRMISLSVYGQPPNHLYAAVWVQRAGSSYQAIHEASASAYQSWFDTNNQAGYVSTLVTVTGSSSSPVYAGVMEKNGVTNWYQKCGLTNSQYLNELNSAQVNRYFLKSFAEYGSSSDRRYCGICAYQATFNAETSKPFWRPSYLSVSEDHLISSAFVDTDIGPWVARHGMTASDLQAEHQTQSAAGYYIIHLQGGGTGSNANYAAIFATQDIPTARTWRVTGSVTGFQNNNAAASQADSLMQSFMQANGIRQAQFTVGKNGNIILQRAYTWAESTRHTTSTSDVFLLASISKMFLEAAVQTLYNQNKLTPSTLVYPLLGYTDTPDSRLQQITVDQLLTHYGGLDDSQSGFDPAYQMRQIAITQGTGANPATIKDIVDYMSKVSLDYDPGARYAYSNYGYILLSYLVEHVTGQDYYAYLKSSVLQPGGYDVRQWPTSPSAHVNDPITQESRYTGLSAAQPQNQALIADIFGGDGMYKENDYGGAALAASATTLVNFIHTHAVWGIGGRQPGTWDREGSTPGTETWAESLDNGIDFSVVINTRDFAPQSNDPFADVLCPTTIPNFLNANPTA